MSDAVILVIGTVIFAATTVTTLLFGFTRLEAASARDEEAPAAPADARDFPADVPVGPRVAAADRPVTAARPGGPPSGPS